MYCKYQNSKVVGRDNTILLFKNILQMIVYEMCMIIKTNRYARELIWQYQCNRNWRFWSEINCINKNICFAYNQKLNQMKIFKNLIVCSFSQFIYLFFIWNLFHYKVTSVTLFSVDQCMQGLSCNMKVDNNWKTHWTC